MGHHRPAEIPDLLLREPSDMWARVVVEEVNFALFPAKFGRDLVELLAVHLRGDCSSLWQQVPMDHSFDVPPAAQKDPLGVQLGFRRRNSFSPGPSHWRLRVWLT